MKDSNEKNGKKNARQMQTNKRQEWEQYSILDKVEFKVKH